MTGMCTFFLGEAHISASSLKLSVVLLPFFCGSSVHPVILYIVIGMLCLWEEISQNLPMLPSYIHVCEGFLKCVYYVGNIGIQKSSLDIF